MSSRIIEFIPILLACVVLVTASLRFDTARRTSDRVIATGQAISATLLIIAQTSYWSMIGQPEGIFQQFFPDAIWTIFNSLVMVIFIAGTLPRCEK